MPFLISIDSPAAIGAQAIKAGQAQAAWGNAAIAQQQQAFQEQQRRFAVQQEQQAFENNLHQQQLQMAWQQNQREDSYRQQQLKALEDYRRGTLDLGQQRVQTQQNVAQQNNATRTQINQQDNDTRIAIANMKDDQFQQTFGLRKEQVQSNIDYHDRLLQQGDQKIQQLDAWRQAQLQAGANRLQVEQAYHQQVNQMRQTEEANRNNRAAAEARLSLIRQRLSQLDTDNPTTPEGRANKEKERTQLYTESEELKKTIGGASQPSSGGKTAPPATAPSTQPTPGVVPQQAATAPAASKPSIDDEFRKAYAASHQPFSAMKTVEAIGSLMAKGYTTAPDGTPLEVVKQRQLKLAPIEMAIHGSKELDEEQLRDLVYALGSVAAAKQYLASNGYDIAGRPGGQQGGQ